MLGHQAATRRTGVCVVDPHGGIVLWRVREPVTGLLDQLVVPAAPRRATRGRTHHAHAYRM